MLEVTTTTGARITRDESVLCYPNDPNNSPYHDWLYLKEKKSYKCRRCMKVIEKVYLKLLTDEGD